MQALNAWSLTVAGVAGLVAVGAVLLAAFTSTRLAEQSRIVAEARRPPLVLAPTPAPVPAVVAPPAPAGFSNESDDTDRLHRRARAFAALVRTRTPELALIVGHGPGAHDLAMAMREALRGAGVTVRWCRLKPDAELGRQSPDGGLAVYADPRGPDAGPLVAALQAVGFPAILMAARDAETGLPSPSIYFTAPVGAAAAAADLQSCNPVVRTGSASH